MLGSLVIGTAAALAPAPLAKLAIDDGIIPGNLGRLSLIVGAFVVAALVVWAATSVQTYLVEWVGQRALADLRLAIFDQLQRLPVSFYERRPAGVLISRMTNDVEALDSLVTDSVVTLFQGGLTLIGTLGILIYLDPHLALITLATAPAIAVGSLVFRIVSADAYRRTRETIGEITGYLQESLSGVRVVRTFGQEHRHAEEFAQLNELNRAANMRTVNLNAAYFPAIEFISAVATVVVLLYGGSQVLDGAIKVGVLVGFLTALSNFFNPITQLSQLYTTYQAGMAALDKIFELLDEQPEMVERPGAQAARADPRRARLRPRQLLLPPARRPRGAPRARRHRSADRPRRDRGARRRDRRRQVDLREARRALLRPDRRARADRRAGHPRCDLRLAALAAGNRAAGGVPVLGHDRGPTSPSAGPTRATAEVEEAARAIGAHDFIAALEHGYDTEVGERGVALSAGQRQLVAFARAMIADPRILVLDEATSNVDVHTEMRIERGLRRLLAGRTAIVIAHRLSTIAGATRIVVLAHGRIVEQGTHEELVAAGGAYARLYRDWSKALTAA